MVENLQKVSTYVLARMSFAGKTVRSSNAVKLLGVILDKNINFKSHIEHISFKTINKISALFQVKNFLTLEQANVWE